MFARIIGRRATALATTLAVVVGLAITPAFAATAAEGDPVVVEPIAVVEEAPAEDAATPVDTPEPVVPAAPEALDAPVDVLPDAPAAAELVPADMVEPEAQSPIAPLGARVAGPAAAPEAAGVASIAAPAAIDFGIQPATIASAMVGDSVDVQFSSPFYRWVDRWRGAGLPPGLELSDSGKLTGSYSSPGTYTFVVKAQMWIFGWGGFTLSDVDSRSYTVTVSNPAPIITTLTLPGATVGSAYPSTQLAASGNGVITWSATGLPSGLTLDSATGVISGTPEYSSTYGASTTVPIMVTANNGRDSAQKVLNLTIITPAPVLDRVSLPDATVGVPYSQQLTVTDGFGDLKFKLTNNASLPDGLELSESGLIFGTPKYDSTAGASMQVNFRARVDGTAGNDAKNFSITLKTPSPVLNRENLPDATVDVPYSHQLTVTDGFGDLKFKLTNNAALPDGLQLSESGLIFGTPKYDSTAGASMQVNFRVRVDGTAGNSARNFSITLKTPAPTITTTTLPEAWLTETYSQAIATTGPSVTVTASQMPAGLRLEGSPGTGYSITGIPTASGDLSVELIAENAGGATSPTTIVLTVNAAPGISTTVLPAATVGSPYSVIITATGKDVTFTATSSLPGVQISATGELTWAFTGQRTGAVEVTATNRSGSVSKTFRLDSYIVPTILTTDLGFGVVGTAFTQTVDFTGRSSEVTVTAGALPTGLSMFKTGKFKGEPTAPGTYSFEITVKNPVGTASRLFEVTVYDVPVIQASSLTRAVVGQAYTDRVQFSGFDAEATVVNGALPAGLTLNTNGTFSGAPTETGAFGFTVEVANPAGSVKHRYRIVSFDVPAFVTTTLSAGVVGANYSAQLMADGHNVRFVLPNRSNLPAGLTLDADGSIHGTPTAAGDYTFDVRARNFAGTTVMTFTMTITEPVLQLSAPSIIRGNSVTVSGSGYLPGDDLELWLHSTPVLLGTVTAANGTFTSTVVIPANTPAGQHQLVVVAAQSGTHSVPITIALPAVAVTPALPQQPQPTTQAQRPALTVTPSIEQTATDEVDEAEEADESDDTDIEETEAEEDLPTLNKPEAAEEAAAVTPVNWTGLLVAAFALLLAALALWFILWRRRSAES